MIKKPLFLLLLFLLIMLQIYPLLPFADDGIRPDFILILAVYFSIGFPLERGAFAVFILGCLIEVFSGVNYGLYPLVYLTVFITIKSLERLFDFSSLFHFLLLAAISLLIKFFLLLFCFKYIYEYRHFAVQDSFFKEFIYTLILFPPVFAALSSLYKVQKESMPPDNAIATYERRHR